MTLFNLGILGGLLFLAIVVITFVVVLAALFIGWLGSKVLDDVNRIEAAQYQHKDSDK